jgi:hypothetical protein
MTFQLSKAIAITTFVLAGFSYISPPANSNESVSGTCSTVQGSSEVNLCKDGQSLLLVHEDGFGVEKPEPGFTSTIKVIYEGSTWKEFSASTSKDGVVSFDYESSLSNDVVITSTENPVSLGSSNCGSPTYNKKFGWRVNQPYEWWYREFNQADYHSLYRVKDAFRTWELGANRCNSTIIKNSYKQNYMGKTTLSHPYQENFFLESTFDTCLNPGPKDMVAWGTMPGETLAGACLYTPNWDVLHFTPARASIIINWLQPWYTDPSSSGCKNSRFDLQAAVTHEVGHTLGLDHYNHVGQAMTPKQGYCATDKRGLGYGDVHGIAALYPAN